MGIRPHWLCVRLWSNVCKGLHRVWKKVLCTMAVTVLAMAVISSSSLLQPSVMIACCFYCRVPIPVWSATWVTTAAQGRLSVSLVEKYATLGVCLCLLLFSIGVTSSCTVETDSLRAALKHWLGSHCSPSCSGSCLQDVLSAGLQVWCLSYLFDECNSGSLGLPWRTRYWTFVDWILTSWIGLCALNTYTGHDF